MCVIGIRSLACSKKSSLLICFKLKGSEGSPSYFANEIALLQSLTSFLTELAVAFTSSLRSGVSLRAAFAAA